MLEPTHILIVEDEPMIRRIYHDVLGGEGYRVSQAASGEEALAYLQLITPDLILLDLGLPGIDGYEVTRQIKADRSKPFTPVMVVSAQADLVTSVSVLDAGADDFLVKPIEIDELLARVRAMLRLQRAQRGLQRAQRKTELLLHLTRDLGASIDLDVLLTRFLNHLADAVGAVRASIILSDFDNDERTLYYSSSRNPATSVLPAILRQGVAGWVMRELRTAVIADTRDDERWLNASTYHSNVRSVAATPIMREGRAFGVITLVHHTPSFFTEEHVELLTSVAAQSAVALESARLFRLTRRQTELLAQRAEELRKVNEINAYLSELMAPDQVTRLLVYMIQQQFGYPLVYLFWREKDELVLQAAAGSLSAGLLLGSRLRTDRGLNGWAIRHQQILQVDDVTLDSRFEIQLPDDGLVRSQLILPIVLRREVLGTLDVRSYEVGAFGSNDAAVLSAIVSQFSTALGNARLLELEQQRIAQLSQVNRLSVDLTAQLDAPQHLQAVARSVAKIFTTPYAGLLLCLEGEQEKEATPQVALAGRVTVDDELALAELVANQPRLVVLGIAQLKRPMLLDNLAQYSQLAALQPFLDGWGIRAVLAVPLIAGARTLGLLVLDATSRPDGFGRADLELVGTVASLIVQVIENARLYRVVADERSTLNAVLRGAADPILLVGPEHELLLANRAAEERLGLVLAQGHGLPLEQQVGMDAAVLHQLLPLIAQGRNDGAAGEITQADDVTYSVSVAPVRGSDEQPLGSVTVLRDISPIKRLERQERERVRSVFRRYVSPQVAEQLLSAGDDFGRPTERDVAVIFADLRGFTSITERTEPRILIENILNRYYTILTDVLYAHDGTVDKFLGDGMIAVFGTPIARPDDPQRALEAAVAIHYAFNQLAQLWQDELGYCIGMGVGMSYGRATIGNIGSKQRQDYTLIGDVVNTAARLSGVAQAGQIIVSHHLISALPATYAPPWHLRPLGPVQIKGKQDPHPIFQVDL
ncbi:MAG: GAF domain-containing protein [Candidatus Viridilinea halotolerans]|uniref:GAF domain-containing protein n=1 Tax=Candidatus Viridilinea halotolerans TaxID=2491704 RepID=A0A426U7L8_9CHLR|nr:MAG: GAF domain-containing protein [Candidatus Viridilinea halotolerans]